MRALAVALVLTTAAVGAQAPASVSGTLTADATKVALTAGSAVSYAGGGGRFVSVLLSDKAPDAARFAEDTRIGAGEKYVPGTFEGAWAGMHMAKGFSGFTFSVDTKNQILTNIVLVGGRNKTFSLVPEDLVLEVKTLSPRFSGRIRSKQPVLDLGERKAGIDATFDVPVVAR